MDDQEKAEFLQAVDQSINKAIEAQDGRMKTMVSEANEVQEGRMRAMVSEANEVQEGRMKAMIGEAIKEEREVQDGRMKTMIGDAIKDANEVQEGRMKEIVIDAIKAQDDRLGLKLAEGEQERNKQAFKNGALGAGVAIITGTAIAFSLLAVAYGLLPMVLPMILKTFQ